MLRVIPHEILVSTEKILGESAISFDFIGGGCINNGGRLATKSTAYFIKWNDRQKFPGMFAAEAKGLQLLSATNTIDIPEVVAENTTSSFQFLILRFIESAAPSQNYWTDFGRSLASLHRNTSTLFGLDHDNYIGSLYQGNKPTSAWIDFFVAQRLEPQLRKAVDAHLADQAMITKFEKFYPKLPDLIPEEPPSLLHGDLWSGNLMRNGKGLPCIIDPSVYYGHREVDLAMTHLFGGFDVTYLNAYQEKYPLVPGFWERIDIYNLYPLLVHVNLFGKSYLAQVLSILNRFV